MVAPLKVGVAGLGTVGSAVVATVREQKAMLAARCGRPIEIVAVCARSKTKKRGIDLRGLRWFSDPLKLAIDPSIDLFVELMGGSGEPAKSAVEAALASGKAVVTANKALLAKHGVALARMAEKQKVALNFEAAVCAAVPAIKTLREGLAGNRINPSDSSGVFVQPFQNAQNRTPKARRRSRAVASRSAKQKGRPNGRPFPIP